jgi:predicted HicB family RNase H-like nuclease
MAPNEMIRTSLRLSEAEHQKISNIAEGIRLSVNDLIREMIRYWEPPYWVPEENSCLKITLSLSDREHEKVSAWAKVRGITFNQALREIIEQHEANSH